MRYVWIRYGEVVRSPGDPEDKDDTPTYYVEIWDEDYKMKRQIFRGGKYIGEYEP